MGKTLNSKIRGVTFNNPDGENRQDIIKKFAKSGSKLILEYENFNKKFKYSIAVFLETTAGIKQLGYLSRDFGVNYFYRIDQLECFISEITGLDDEGKNIGVNIKLIVPDQIYPLRYFAQVNLLKGPMKRYHEEFSELSEIDLGLDDDYNENIAVYSNFGDYSEKRTKIGSISREVSEKLYRFESKELIITSEVETIERDLDDIPENLELLITIETKEQYKERMDRINEKIALKKTNRIISPPSNLPTTPIGNALPKPTIKTKPPKPIQKSISPKSRTIALILCILLGYFGGHQFYAGRKTMGIIYIFTIGLFFIGWIIDFILIILGQYKDKEGRLITTW